MTKQPSKTHTYDCRVHSALKKCIWDTTCVKFVRERPIRVLSVLTEDQCDMQLYISDLLSVKSLCPSPQPFTFYQNMYVKLNTCKKMFFYIYSKRCMEIENVTHGLFFFKDVKLLELNLVELNCFWWYFLWVGHIKLEMLFFLYSSCFNLSCFLL